uniref:HMG box domain-containing protein n=1 Tax=Glossina palpalis gambiensis TaxID=67801 RepID=A0A1B0AUX0_9MUSC
MTQNNDYIKLECDVKCERKSSSENPCQEKEIYQSSTARTSMTENNEGINIGCEVKCERKPSTESSCRQKRNLSELDGAYLILCVLYRQRLKLSCKKLRQPDICRRAGKKWQGMKDCEKQPYILLGAKEQRKGAVCIET